MNEYNSGNDGNYDGGDNDDDNGRDAKHGVSTNQSQNQFGPQYKNLASIIGGFKSAVTTFARKNHLPFNWQSRFHDHIIRNEQPYQRIKNYIISNPRHWNSDSLHL